MSRKILPLLLLLCFGNIFFATAQQKPEQQKTVEEKPAPTGLVLEVGFLKNRPPAYIAIGATLQTTHWAWYAAFERLPNFQTTAEKPPVQAVKFIPYLEDGAVKVKVRVFVGEKSFEREEQIALYSMREGERVAVKELTDYGVAPFEIAVVRVAPSVSVLPLIENKTASLQVTSIEPNYSTLPTIKISLLNASAKAVSAYTFEITENGRIRVSGMPQNQHGEVLIEPGATLTREMQIPPEYKKPTDGEAVPKPANGQTIVISSAIFADGTYEGDAPRAGRFLAYNLGRKMQIKRVIALLESFETANSKFNFERLTEQSSKFETKIGEQEFNALLKQFPSLTEQEKTDLRESAEATAQDVKDDFTDGATRHRAELEASGGRAYLAALKEQYQKWLARLQ